MLSQLTLYPDLEQQLIFIEMAAYLHTTSSATYIGPIKDVAGGVNAYIGALQTATRGVKWHRLG